MLETWAHVACIYVPTWLLSYFFGLIHPSRNSNPQCFFLIIIKTIIADHLLVKDRRRLEKTIQHGSVQVHAGGVAQEAVGGDALFAARSLLAVPPVVRHPPMPAAHSPREGPSTRISRQAGYAHFSYFILLYTEYHMLMHELVLDLTIRIYEWELICSLFSAALVWRTLLSGFGWCPCIKLLKPNWRRFILDTFVF